MQKFYNPLIFLCSLFLFSFSLQAQDAGDKMFDNNVLHEVRFQFSQSNYWNQLVSNFEDNFDPSIPVPYLLGNVTIDGELVDSIGVRFKGFTSYQYDSNKKPIKIDFNEFVKGKRYDGLRKLNLHIAYGDASLHRDVLAYQLMRDMGVHAPRTAWAKVYFNDQYWGLYQIIEQVDKEFLNRNFANAKGNLFKNKGWSHLEWLSEDKNDYKENLELKTNEEGDDWSGLIEMINILNNSSDSDFKTKFEKKFNVELFLKTLAVDVATNNWDSYLQHGRNYYMYEDTTTGIINWIPWDYNFSLGGGFVFNNSDCFIWPSFTTFTDDSNTASFRDWSYTSSEGTYSWDFGDGNTSEEIHPIHTYDTKAEYQVCLTITIDEDCIETLCEFIDLNYDYSSCNSIQNGSCPHEADIVFSSVVNFRDECCGQWSEDCEDLYSNIDGTINGTGGSDDFSIDQSENEGALINRILAVEEYRKFFYQQFCDLMNNVMREDRIFAQMDKNFELIDNAAETELFSLFTYEDFLEDIGQLGEDLGLKSYFTRRIAGLNQELPELYDCPVQNMALGFGEVVINEIVASNDSIGGEADPDGGYPDWIELYNTTDFTIDLSEVYLSDDELDLRKWQFPEGTMIDEDDYLIVWADNDLDQQGIHASFKLSKGGEQLYLSNAVGTVIDSMSFGEQQTNIAYARIPNGSGDFKFWTTTFDGNNDEGASNTKDDKFDQQVSVFPNPSSGEFNIEIKDERTGPYYFELMDAAGQLIFQNKNLSKKSSIDLSNYASGIYLMRIINSQGRTTSKKLTRLK